MIVNEGKLQIEFKDEWTICKYDLIPKASGKRSVDFIVEETNRLLLIECKDISSFNIKRRVQRSTSQRSAPSYFLSKEQSLIQKCVDSANDVHPTPYAGQTKSFLYVVLIDIEGVPGLQRIMLDRWRERLQQALSSRFSRNPPPHNYIGCVVCDVRAWDNFFSPYRIVRV